MGQLGVIQISQAPRKSWILIPPNSSESFKLISHGKHLQLYVTVVKTPRKDVKRVNYPSFNPLAEPP